MSFDKPKPIEPKPARSALPAILIGCGIFASLGLLLLCGGGLFLARLGFSKLNEFAEPFEQQGYQRVQGQVVNVDQPVSSPTVYIAQVVNFRADVDADIAVMAQMVEVHSTIRGDIDFQGQVLLIKPGAVVKGDIRSKMAQVIDVGGTVEGEITGSYQTLRRGQESPIQTHERRTVR